MCVTCGCGQGVATVEGEVTGAGPHTHADGTTHAHADGSGVAHRHGDGGAHRHTHPAGEVDLHLHGDRHAHPDEHEHEDHYGQGQGDDGGSIVQARDVRTVALEIAVLGKNQANAERNRGWLAGRGVLALNLMSSPGAGKTTLLERCIRDLHGEISISVVEGDQATANDAQRIRATGASAVQVNTGTGCHLEAGMLERALKVLQPPAGSLVVIENVGNLVCPALFDLGENARVVICSVTEGEDKPLKYPHMFRAADVLLLSKTDLLPHLRVDLQLMKSNALAVNPRLQIFAVSSYSGDGLDDWYGWLRAQRAALV